MFSSRENQRYYDFDVRFHPRVVESWFVMFYWLIITKHTSVNALIHRQQTVCWISAQTKLRSIYRHELIVIYCALMKHQALHTIQAKLKLAIKLIIFFTFRSWCNYLSGEFLASVRQEEGNFEVLKRSYIQIYPVIVFCCVREKLLLFKICETLSLRQIKQWHSWIQHCLTSLKLEPPTTKTLRQNSNIHERIELWAVVGQKYQTFRWFIRMSFPPTQHTQKSSQHARACATGDGAICSKNRKIVPYHGHSPNSRISARLRSPSLIMAPGCYYLVMSGCSHCKNSVLVSLCR